MLPVLQHKCTMTSSRQSRKVSATPLERRCRDFILEPVDSPPSSTVHVGIYIYKEIRVCQCTIVFVTEGNSTVIASWERVWNVYARQESNALIWRVMIGCQLLCSGLHRIFPRKMHIQNLMINKFEIRYIKYY